MSVLKENLYRILRAFLRVVWVTLNNLYCIPVYLFIYVISFPLYLFCPHLFYRVEQNLFSWLLSMVSCWSYTAGYDIAESGDSLDESVKSRILYMPNHQSTADVPFLMTIFSTRFGYSGKVMWLMDKVFMYTNFGIVSWLHGDFFIQAGRDTREQSLLDLRDHLHNVFVKKDRKCLVLFPEGGFLRKRKAVSQSYAKKKDLPIFEHCTLPRTGALQVILKDIGNEGSYSEEKQITKLIDVTIAYPKGNPLDLVSIVTGWRPPCTTHVHYREFYVKDLPTESDALFDWMVKLYQEKEAMLAEFYRSGEFPYKMFNKDTQPPAIIQHSAVRYIVGHTLFVAMTAVVFSSLLHLCPFM